LSGANAVAFDADAADAPPKVALEEGDVVFVDGKLVGGGRMGLGGKRDPNAPPPPVVETAEMGGVHPSRLADTGGGGGGGGGGGVSGAFGGGGGGGGGFDIYVYLIYAYYICMYVHINLYTYTYVRMCICVCI